VDMRLTGRLALVTGSTAGIGYAITTMASPRRSPAVVATAWRNPVGRYSELVERGWVREVSDGAELAVRRKAPRYADHLSGPARSAASTYVRGRSRMRSRGGNSANSH
jgi:NAD(P)-dependent dehydrogenase (short-subunit alcohol dehydrogenase family)